MHPAGRLGSTVLEGWLAGLALKISSLPCLLPKGDPLLPPDPTQAGLGLVSATSRLTDSCVAAGLRGALSRGLLHARASGLPDPDRTTHRDPTPLRLTAACPLPERHPPHPRVHGVKALALPVAGGPRGVGRSPPPISSATRVHRLWGHQRHQSQPGPHEKLLGAQALGEADDWVSVLGPLRRAFLAEGWQVPLGAGAGAGAGGQLRASPWMGACFCSKL